MLGRRLLNGFRRAFANQSKLIIVGFATLDHSSHWFNELASFKREGGIGLGLAVRIAVPRSTESLSRQPYLPTGCSSPYPAWTSTSIILSAKQSHSRMLGFCDPARARLDAENTGERDLIYFPHGHPILIHGIGLWLAKRLPERRPSVFFRITGDELTDLDTGRFKARAAFTGSRAPIFARDQDRSACFFSLTRGPRRVPYRGFAVGGRS